VSIFFRYFAMPRISLFLRWLGVGLLALSAVHVSSSQLTRVRSCTPLPTFPPCQNCTSSDRDRAVSACQVGKFPFFHLQPAPNGGEPHLVHGISYDLHPGHLGNRLARFYTARALIILGNYTAEPAVLQYEHVNLKLLSHLPRRARYSRVPELEYYCNTCPLRSEWFNACPGLFLAADIRKHLRRGLHHHLNASREVDVVIQFRCSDGHSLPVMGLLTFEYYFVALSGRVSSRSHIVILPDNGVQGHKCCTTVALMLTAALRHTFHCTVEFRSSSSVATDLALLMKAKILVCGPSTFGLFASLAGYGEFFLPISGGIIGESVALSSTRALAGHPNSL